MKLNRRKFLAAMFGGAAAAVIPFKLTPKAIPVNNRIEIKEYGNSIAYTPTDDRILQIQKNMAEAMDRAAAEAFRGCGWRRYGR